MQKIDNVNVSSENDNFVTEVVKEQMIRFRERVKKNPGTSIKGRRPSAERLLKNIDKINEAIETISEDIKIKK
jgi:hypothetical protein